VTQRYLSGPVAGRGRRRAGQIGGPALSAGAETP